LVSELLLGAIMNIFLNFTAWFCLNDNHIDPSRDFDIILGNSTYLVLQGQDLALSFVCCRYV